MPGITVNIDVNRGLSRIGATGPQARKALARALNKTIISARAKASNQIRAAGFKVNTGTIKKHLRVIKANAGSDELTVAVRSIGAPLPLSSFAVYPKPTVRGNGFARPAVGIWASVLGTTHGSAHAFYVRMPSGHIGVYLRAGSARLPLVEVKGPAIPDGLADAATIAAAKAAFDARLPLILEHELEFVVG